MFAPVACERGRRFERVPRLRIAAELVKQVASNAWQQVIGFECGLMQKRIRDLQPRFRAFGMPTATARLSSTIEEGATAARCA